MPEFAGGRASARRSRTGLAFRRVCAVRILVKIGRSVPGADRPLWVVFATVCFATAKQKTGRSSGGSIWPRRTSRFLRKGGKKLTLAASRTRSRIDRHGNHRRLRGRTFTSGGCGRRDINATQRGEGPSLRSGCEETWDVEALQKPNIPVPFQRNAPMPNGALRPVDRRGQGERSVATRHETAPPRLRRPRPAAQRCATRREVVRPDPQRRRLRGSSQSHLPPSALKAICCSSDLPLLPGE